MSRLVRAPEARPVKNWPSFSTSAMPGRTNGSMTPPATLTASGTRSPSRASLTERATETPAFSCASSVLAPRCGVTMTFGRSSRRAALESAFGGSLVNTSRPAPAISPRGQRRVQRLFVDESAAGDVHDVGGRLHDGELRLADHPGRLGRLRHVHRDEVALREHLVERQQLDLQLLRARGRHVGVVADDAHAEGTEALGDEGADAAETEDADRLLVELGAGERAALPLAGGKRGVRGRDVAREAQDVPDGELGGRDDVGGRGVDDHDAGARRGLDVDVVEPDAGAGDDLERRSGGKGLGIDPGRGADEHRVRLGERGEQRRTVGAVDVAHVEVGPEGIDRGG